MKHPFYTFPVMVAGLVIIITPCFSQANTSLSNLTSPTSVNEHLFPGLNNDLNLGSPSKSWKDIYIDGYLYLDDQKFISNAGQASTFVGVKAGNSNKGESNTAFGYQALPFNTVGSFNTAIGFGALYSNIDADDNTAIGHLALYFNTTGHNNTATGEGALYYNATGDYNTSNGAGALNRNTEGDKNTASGFDALNRNTTGNENTANGADALNWNTTGYENTAIGHAALYENTTGIGNTAVGNISGFVNDANSYCSFFGYDADQPVFENFINSTTLGYKSRITGDNQVRIGNSSVTSIGGYQNWTNISDGRYKQNISENVPGLDFINLLKPVTYTLNISGISESLGEYTRGEEGRTDAESGSIIHQKDDQGKQLTQQSRDEKSQIIYSGFIAQEVEKAAKQIGYDFSGVDKPQNEYSLYGLRYAEFVVPLVKAVQELDEEAGSQESRIMMLEEENKKWKEEYGEQQKQIDELKAMLLQLESGLSRSNQEVNMSGVQLMPEELQKSTPYLEQNIPNPFDGTTMIRCFIPEGFSSAELIVTAANGVTSMKTTLDKAGINEIRIDARAISGGSYNYSLVVDGQIIDTKQMILTK